MKLFYFSALLLICFFFACTSARRIERRSQPKRNRNQYEDILSSTSTQPTSRAFEELTSEPVRAKSTRTELVLIKPQIENANTGRFLHNLWLGQRNNIGQGQNGPVFVLNIPVNLNNTNNNTLTNNPPAAAVTAAVDAGGIVRLTGASPAYSYLSNAKAIRKPIRLPTQVYQQREGNQQQPGNVQILGVLGPNGDIVPVVLPNNVLGGQPKRNKNQQQNGNWNRNPFANYFKRVQYL